MSNIFELIDRGDTQEMIKSIQRGTSVNLTHSMRTLLHNACFHGHFDIIKTLVKYGADLEAKDIMGWTALRYACAHGSIKIIRFLVEKGAKIDAVSCRYWSSLHSAAGLGHIECCKYFIDQGADLSLKTIDGLTPLHIASVYGQKKEIVRYMVEHGADIEAKDPNGSTCLQLACQIGNIDIVQTLLTLGSDPFQVKNTKFWNVRIVTMLEVFQTRDVNRTESCKNMMMAARALLLSDRLSTELCFHILSFMAIDLDHPQLRLLCKVLMDRRSLGHLHPSNETTWLSLLTYKKVPFTNRLLLKQCKLYMNE